MTSQFDTEKTIVLGYGGYEKIENSLLNKIIRFETILTAVQYFSWAKAGLPYMGVGRNLAYKKDEFFNVNGCIDHIQVRSGDDDLFINQAANKSNTAISYTPESFTYSKPKESFKDWFTQKRRHVSTAEHYKFFDKFQLGLFFFSQLFFFLSVIILLAFQFQWIAVVAILATRYTVVWTVIGFSAGKLKENDIKIWFPVLEIVLIVTQINIFITNIFSKPVYWK
jgi:hypothetical protein